MSTTACLVLDVDFQPLSIAPLKKIFGKLINGKVEVVSYSADGTIRAERIFRVPSVVRVLTRFNRHRMQIKFSRQNIYARDGFKCGYCRQKFVSEELTFDHVLPRAQGGQTNWLNITTACVDCNFKKAARTPEQAGMKLARKPFKPTFLPVVTIDMRGGVPEDWKAYWAGALEP